MSESPPAFGKQINISIEAEGHSGRRFCIAQHNTVCGDPTEGQDDGLSSELAFWRDEIVAKRNLDTVLSVARSKDEYQYYCPEFLLNFAKNECPSLFPGEPLRALDVGCGPFSQLVGGQVQGLFQVTAVDPLAREYVALAEADASFQEFPVRPIYGSGETITTLFPENTFHIVYIGNALDHTQDPAMTIENIYKVLKRNGVLMVIFYENEGTTEMWHGLHQHNLSMDGQYLRCTNKFGDSFLITKQDMWRGLYVKNLDYASNMGRALLETALQKI